MKANDSRLLVQRHVYVSKNGTPRVTGVFVAFYDGEAKKVRTGFSRVNFASGDKFNMEIGLSMAISEAVLPHQFLKDNEENQYFWDNYVAFLDRATRYYGQGLHDVPVSQRPKRVYLGKNDTFTLHPVTSIGMAGLKGLNQIRNSKKIQIAEADKMLGDIAKSFKAHGYSPEVIQQKIGALGVADKEAMKLLKKHFPTLDTSKILIVD